MSNNEELIDEREKCPICGSSKIRYKHWGANAWCCLNCGAQWS